MTMHVRWTHALFTSLLAIAVNAGCAAPTDDAANGAAESTAQAEVTQSTDAAIGGKLRGILKDVTFTSESDFGYVVLEGDAATEKRLSKKLVRQKLQAAIKIQSSSHRDILSTSCRASRINVSSTIADGNAVDADDEDRHDKQLSIALKVMRSQLRSVVGFRLGEDASGDQDDVGPVVIVYVGISKTTGKLIAIMTEGVFT